MLSKPCMGFGNKKAPGVSESILRAEHASGLCLLQIFIPIKKIQMANPIYKNYLDL